MLDGQEKGRLSFEVHACCGICERKIRLIKKVRTLEEACEKLRDANWVKTERLGWICFICKENPERVIR